MNWFYQLIGEGSDPNPVQMAIRVFIIFIIALVFIRLSGRLKGGRVKSRKQAIAIGISEARAKGDKVPEHDR